ncbi:MAG: Glu-tRNA(Gln) amidotransferase subunit GatE, partial [Candidatus Pacearchaeota archaeon]
NYAELSLKLGLEVHQQLDSNRKLFCNCPSILRSDDPDIVIKRKLHAVAGESGEVDIAVRHEIEQEKEFIYQGYSNTNCLLEYDESPPYFIDLISLKTALQIALLLNCKIFPITQIMRKTVLDGSNTSGFQRTVLIARDGWIETNYGRVGIDTVCLEEDSARIIDREGKIAIYRLDRLGIPLVEIATAPDIKNPGQAKETALLIGDILRSCKVKRGIGTIRQDVNLSIKDGKRIELKGFQDIRNIETAIAKETERQIELVAKNESVSEVRNVLPDGTSKFLRPMPGAARMYPETDLPLLKISHDLVNEAKKKLPQLRTEAEKDFKKYGLNEEMIKLLFKYNKMDEFRELLNVFNNPQLVAKILLIYPKEIATKNNLKLEFIREKLSADVLQDLLEKVKKGKINENEVKNLMNKIILGDDISKVLTSTEKIDMDKIEDKIRKLVKDNPGLSGHAYMGIVMKEFKGSVSGKDVMEIIKRY